MISDRARITDEAKVSGEATVEDDALVDGNARVTDKARIAYFAHISGNALVCGKAGVFDSAKVSGNAEIRDYASVFDCAHVTSNALLGSEACIKDGTLLDGPYRITGPAQIPCSGDVFLIGPMFSDLKTVTVYPDKEGCAHVNLGDKAFDVDEFFALTLEDYAGNQQDFESHKAICSLIASRYCLHLPESFKPMDGIILSTARKVMHEVQEQLRKELAAGDAKK